MFKILRVINKINRPTLRIPSRTFLSPAYYCNEVWEHRLNDDLFRKVNLDEFYYAIDQRFQKTREMSAIDVDVFVNAANEDIFVDELLDLVHKLRLSADTTNTLESTSHAVVRYLTRFDFTNRLLDVLDDRLNYGVFLDYYTANLLLDIFWKRKEYVSGARVASQLMLQEEVDHPLFKNLALAHCYKFLLDPVGWPEPVKPEEPEEEVKVRVKYLRNPYFDDHFDLRDPLKIVGKTLMALTEGQTDALSKSFYILGAVLYDKVERAEKLICKLLENGESVVNDVMKLLPKETEINQKVEQLKADSADVEALLAERIKSSERALTEKDVATQCKIFDTWEKKRRVALEEQNERILKAKRLAEVEKSLQDLKERETKLWFFENEEKIELAIEESEQVLAEKATVEVKKEAAVVDENYVPPEIRPPRQ